MEIIIFGKEGDKTYLTPISMTHKDYLLRWANDYEVTRHLSLRYPANEKIEENFIESATNTKEAYKLVIVAKDKNQPIGTIGLINIDWINRKSELGIMIAEKEYWGKGYGPDAIKILLHYAFNRMNLNKVVLRVNSDNIRATKAYEKIGFKKSGTERKDVFLDGKYIDAYRMEILEEEYRKL